MARIASWKASARASAWPLDLDADKHREADLEARALKHRAIAFDIPLVLEPLHPAQARRRREADALREVDIAQPAIGLQRGDDPAIDGVESAFGMIGYLERRRGIVLRKQDKSQHESQGHASPLRDNLHRGGLPWPKHPASPR